MDLVDLVPMEAVETNMNPRSKTEWIAQLVKRLACAYGLTDEEGILAAVLERETVQSTDIGHGVALPHAKIDRVERTLVALGIATEGVDFGSAGAEPVYCAFLVVSPKSQPSSHVQALAAITRVVIRTGVVEKMRKASSARSLRRTLREEENQL